MDDDLIDNYDHINNHIFYVPACIPGKGCDLSTFESQISSCCHCTTSCSDACACIQLNGQNYQNNLLIDSKLSPDGAVMECNSRCECTNCTNRLVQLGPHPDLEIIQTGPKGYGLTSRSLIKKGQFVCEYAGEIISHNEASIRRQSDNVNYIFALNEFSNDTVIETIVDATCIANIGRYINHSCDPNCIIVPVRVDSLVPKLAVFARRPISAGEEITYSYSGMNTTEVTGDCKPCLCGVTNCMKFLPYNP